MRRFEWAIPVGKHDQKHPAEIVTKLLKIMTNEVVDYIYNVFPMKHSEKTKYDINAFQIAKDILKLATIE